MDLNFVYFYILNFDLIRFSKIANDIIRLALVYVGILHIQTIVLIRYKNKCIKCMELNQNQSFMYVYKSKFKFQVHNYPKSKFMYIEIK